MMAERHHDLAQRIRAEVPRAIGVYLLRGARDEVLYVGKSVDLRQRLLSYFQGRARPFDGRFQRLVFNTHDFSIETVPTELLALLREDELIKRFLPIYNVRQREFLESCYLRLTDDEFPAGAVEHDREQGGRGRLFGPFRDRFFVERLLDILHRFLGLRACVDETPRRRCARFEIGLCRGPCRGEIDAVEYGRVVAGAEAFLGGDATDLESALTERMQEHARALEFEKAAEIRETIEFVRAFCRRQHFNTRFRRERLEVHTASGGVHLFDRGRLRGYVERESREEIERMLGEPPRDSAGEDVRIMLDRAHVVYSWIRRDVDRRGFLFYP